MKDHFRPGVTKDTHLLGLVPKSCCRPSVWLAEFDAAIRVLTPVVSEEFIERLCSMCANEILGQDLDAPANPTNGPQCEYVEVCFLDRQYGRRTSDYRGRRSALVHDLVLGQ